MRIVSRVALTLVCALSFSCAASAQQAHPPVEAYGALPAISNVQLSPDGKHFSALQTYHGRTAVVIYEVGAPPGTIPAILVDDMHYIRGARWASNDRALVTIYESLRPSVPSQKFLVTLTKP